MKNVSVCSVNVLSTLNIFICVYKNSHLNLSWKLNKTSEKCPLKIFQFEIPILENVIREYEELWLLIKINELVILHYGASDDHIWPIFLGVNSIKIG